MAGKRTDDAQAAEKRTVDDLRLEIFAVFNFNDRISESGNDIAPVRLSRISSLVVSGGVRRTSDSCALLGGFAIGARVSLRLMRNVSEDGCTHGWLLPVHIYLYA